MTRRRHVLKGPPSIWVLEDNPLAARYLVQLLEHNRPRVVGSLDEALRNMAASNECPSVLVVDREALHARLEATLRSARSALPNARVLLVGKSIEDEDLVCLVLQGVRGFVRYDKAGTELGRAINTLSEGHLWIETAVLDKLQDYQGVREDRDNQKTSKFTPRQTAILDMLRERLSNKEIASKLAISERTVKFHLKNVFAKLGVHDRYSAVDMATSDIAERKS